MESGIPSKFRSVADEVKKFLENESSGHDYYHAERVCRAALYFQKSEGGDKEVIGIAALVHDLCRPWEKKTGKSHFGLEALEMIDRLLVKLKIKDAIRKRVLAVVAEHDVYDWTKKTRLRVWNSK